MAVERNSVVVEEYLQVIYALTGSEGPVKAIQLATRLASSPSTVHATLSRMQRDGLVEVGPKKEVLLTSKGQTKAESLVYRHQLVESFLCDRLGIPWHEVHHHAHILEHGLTPLVVERLAEFLGFPGFCPHGTPMPGSGTNLPASTLALSALEEGRDFQVVVIREVLEDQQELMEFLERHHLQPGERLKFLEKIKATDSMLLEYQGTSFSLPLGVADKIGILPLA
ncbi:MAG: hypothetical protein A2600_03850 [Candidatus Lambdaproteobacteria bacterium RIFOXYD1_FULL_56_27]|uniref:Transcriptional regulator MntR n=1 Tax=Candidatus Lambdaproteobacteria bacterium RIFOXYD2_FULL_56_26 TaxID=1817773 RepID=A0A1F6H3D9_9PROT|nr:MAG: hypothetical protein A2426_11260 [Candidatus Lambdaproteobacteria bacterium RIFOXYC1_FULL_56_13]OGH04895.1 MAG: hypothetical protein A2557_07915 [Candidatus Lambdaproteobacteria bacterium RIFOXYD2_FULL_56_26]OGH09360.1 MAG: hypothetical protein A2600_03850 [Candidatus Lambdaproteobacteria bacterium RIFOXYD1_FULL_56_27]